MTTIAGQPILLAYRHPQVRPEAIVASLVPPKRFERVRFATYVPDPAELTQAAALHELRAFAGTLTGAIRKRRWWQRSGERPSRRAGRYIDGGYGVGKTHLLASLWHEAPWPKAYCTFSELTHLVGALGFAEAVRQLSGHRLLAIDEFELDDVGDTVLISSLLGRLADAGVALAVTSNTLPEKLGEGRFAAQDFLREIQGLSSRFTVLRIDGQDYRHRGLPPAPEPLDDDTLADLAAATPGAALDDFAGLCSHLASLHPVRYGDLLSGVAAVFWRGVTPVHDQATALRLVVLSDRLYDNEVPLAASGTPLDQLFPPELLKGGYRKKYLRAVSRLTSLARQAESL